MRFPQFGIDIGGTKIRWVVFSRGAVRHSGTLATPRTRAAFQQTLRTLARRAGRHGCRRIGVCIAGTVRGTKFLYGANIPSVRNFDFRDVFPQPFRVRVDHDARCFARTEAVLGVARGAVSACAFIMGTGVGRAFVRNGMPVALRRFEYSERWEAEYQRYASRSARQLAEFLAPHLARIVTEFKPAIVVLGGGTMRKPQFFSLLRKSIRHAGARCPVLRSRFRQNGPALGAVLG